MNLKCIVFLIFLMGITTSCKPVKNELDKPNGYIVILENRSKRAIDTNIDFWYLEKVIEYPKDNITFKSYYMLLKDLYDFQLCCQDPKNTLNEKLENESSSYNNLVSSSVFKKEKNLLIKMDNENTLKIYKVYIKHCICSKEYSLFPNLSTLNEYSYPIDFEFLNFEGNEKKYFKENSVKILNLLK